MAHGERQVYRDAERAGSRRVRNGHRLNDPASGPLGPVRVQNAKAPPHETGLDAAGRWHETATHPEEHVAPGRRHPADARDSGPRRQLAWTMP